MKRPRVLLADHHSVLTDSVAHFLRGHYDVVAVARDGKEMVELARQHKPDVIVTGISLPKLNGIDAARLVRKEARSAKIIFLTMHDDFPLIEAAFRAGGKGFVRKTSSAAELLNAIQTVLGGNVFISSAISGELISNLLTTGAREKPKDGVLTVRQRQILQLLAEGKTMKEAAAIMGISTRTAESHKYESMRTLGVKTTADLIRHAMRIKLV